MQKKKQAVPDKNNTKNKQHNVRDEEIKEENRKHINWFV